MTQDTSPARAGPKRMSADQYNFADFELDVAKLELRRGDEGVHITPLAFDVLCYLVKHRDRVVPKDELLDKLWKSRIVSESSLAAGIKHVRKALGDDGRTQRMIRTVHGRGYQFIGTVDGEVTEPSPPPSDPVRVRFAEVRGGLRLAIGETGQGPPLVKAANWMTHVDKDADSPIWGHWVRELSRKNRFVRYDARGCGLSDRDLAGIALDDLELWVDDLTRVIDTLAIERCALLGISQGGPVATAFAARYPERVSHLLLFGSYARGMNRRGDSRQADQASLQVSLARFGWASDQDRFLEVFTRQFIPDAGPDEREWFNELQKSSTTADIAPQLERAMHDVDVSDLARSVQVPTLVLHSTGDVAVPFEEGRHLASLIPDARFVALPGNNHVLLERDAAWPAFLSEVRRFLDSPDA